MRVCGCLGGSGSGKSHLLRVLHPWVSTPVQLSASCAIPVVDLRLVKGESSSRKEIFLMAVFNQHPFYCPSCIPMSRK